MAGARGEVAAWLLERAGQARRAPPKNPAIGDGGTGEVDVGCAGLDLVLGLPALLAGDDAVAAVRLAAALAPAVAAIDAFERLWLAGDADVDEAAGSPWVALATAGAAGERARLAFAGDRRSSARREEVRDALADDVVLGALRAWWRGALGRGREILAAAVGTQAAVGAAVFGALARGLEDVETHLWVRSLARGAASPVRGFSWQRAEEAVARAVERIARDPAWSSSVDVQRWGVAPLVGELVADWFPRGFIELNLQAIAGGREGRMSELLWEIPPGELRYFRGFRGIPPDIDSLGLMLRVAAEIPDPPRPRVESWLALLENNNDAGVARVWLRCSAVGPSLRAEREARPREAVGATHEPADLVWAGDDCTACRLSLVLGLLRADAPRYDAIAAATLAAALDRFTGGGFAGSYHYTPPFASYLLALIAVEVEGTAGARLPAALAERVRRCRDELLASLVASQRLDGSWGGPQPTAWYLEALCTVDGAPPDAVARAARYLDETQRGDGAWLPEVLYYAVGKPGYMVEYRGIEVTTSICARALAQALRWTRRRAASAPPARTAGPHPR